MSNEEVKVDAQVESTGTTDAAQTAEKEKKDLSKTEQYKVHLQKIIFQELGVKVSKDKAWSLFKDIIHGTVEHVLEIDGKKLPLAGVGTFEILETKPRGSKAGLDKDNKPTGEEAWPCVPRFRFYPSSVVDNLVEFSYGLGNHEVEVKHYGLYKTDEEIAAEKKAEADKPVTSASTKKEKAKTDDSAKNPASTEDAGTVEAVVNPPVAAESTEAKEDAFSGLDDL